MNADNKLYVPRAAEVAEFDRSLACRRSLLSNSRKWANQ